MALKAQTESQVTMSIESNRGIDVLLLFRQSLFSSTAIIRQIDACLHCLRSLVQWSQITISDSKIIESNNCISNYLADAHAHRSSVAREFAECIILA